jgi:hypothetical protein
VFVSCTLPVLFLNNFCSETFETNIKTVAMELQHGVLFCIGELLNRVLRRIFGRKRDQVT